MIKVTEETAFASQPTMEQVMQLAPFGFRSLVCVRPIACVGAFPPAAAPCPCIAPTQPKRPRWARLGAPQSAVRPAAPLTRALRFRAPGACFHCREMCSACRSGVAFHYAPIASAKALEGSAQVGLSHPHSALSIPLGSRPCRSPQNFLRILYAVASLQAAPKPALVHCDEGTYASFVVLLHAAWRSRRGPRRLARWARDLRQDYPRHAPTLKAWSKPLCRIFQFVGPPPADSESPPAAPPTTPPTLHSGHPCHAAQDQPPASHLPSALKPRVEAPDSLHGVPLSDAS